MGVTKTTLSPTPEGFTLRVSPPDYIMKSLSPRPSRSVVVSSADIR